MILLIEVIVFHPAVYPHLHAFFQIFRSGHHSVLIQIGHHPAIGVGNKQRALQISSGQLLFDRIFNTCK